MTNGPIELERLSPAIGAEVKGFDLARLSDADFVKVHDLLMEHQVLFFRDQRLTPDQHLAFARRFGEPQLGQESSFAAIDGYPEIDVLDYDEANPPWVTKELWHSDFSGRKQPTMGSVLYAFAVPAHGGDTIWISTHAAYEALSDRMKRYLEDMTAEHDAMKSFGDDIRANLFVRDVGARERLAQYPPVAHPVVRTHPVTGRRGLYVNEGYTTRLHGVPRAESDAVLSYLFGHLRMPEFQCRFRWTAHCVSVWDNRLTQHYAIADYRERRFMHRITIEGDTPF